MSQAEIVEELVTTAMIEDGVHYSSYEFSLPEKNS